MCNNDLNMVFICQVCFHGVQKINCEWLRTFAFCHIACYLGSASGLFGCASFSLRLVSCVSARLSSCTSLS